MPSHDNGIGRAIMSQYENAWQAVRTRVAEAAEAAGRDPAEVRLLAVSKTFPPEAVRAVHGLGQRAFGENYVQEAADKAAALAGLGIEWRLIGPLQSNKAGRAAAVFDAVESIDRPRLAERLDAARAALPGRARLAVLVQVNISGEASKHGVAPDGALALVRAVARLPALALEGFMGIAAPGIDRSAQRAQFAILRGLRARARDAGLELPVLSMGMSEDLEAAIAEGSTEVRVGSAIFGARTRGDRA